MTFRNVALVIVFILSSPVLSFAEPALSDAEKHLADLFYSEFRNTVVFRLDETGLAPADVERIFSAAVDRYARCVVTALSKLDDPAASKFLELLSQGLSATEINQKFGAVTDPKFADFFAEYDSLFDPCRNIVDSELGIPSE